MISLGQVNPQSAHKAPIVIEGKSSMSQSAASCVISDDVEALSGALFSWCAERGVRLRSQEGVSAAGVVIDLFFAGYRTQDALLGALSERDGREVVFSS
jgi:hypothetical protein